MVNKMQDIISRVFGILKGNSVKVLKIFIFKFQKNSQNPMSRELHEIIDTVTAISKGN